MKRLNSMLASLVLGVALLVTPACSTITAVYDAVTTPVDLSSLRKTALSVNLGYATALDLANTYAAFTPCDQPAAPKICADVLIVNELVRLDGIAAPLLDAMNKTLQSPAVDLSIASASIEAAKNAVAAFKAVLPAPTVK